MSYKEIAQRSISLQAKTLLDLTESLDESFDAVVSAILKTKGKVILCGVGKSGIVARKIASFFLL
jgi:arabinose-5-phosphate isomerase